MKKNKLTTALTVLGLFCVNLLLAQTTVSGSVSDAETNDPIPGVNIIIEGTTDGTNSDFDGNFSFSTDQALPFTIEVSSIGFASQSIEVTSADQALSIALSPGENLEEIVVSASRKPQKVQEAPASVSIISAKDIQNSADAVDPIRQLVNIPGVQIQQQSANTINIEMRAGSGVFGTATFPILDYRYLVTPSSGQFLSYQSGLSNIDIAKIEVVRGAASALYGPGVTSGVVHFISKNPIDYPGTTVELLAGTLNTLGATLRHAFSNESKTLGFKINARITQGDDFELDGTETDPITGANLIRSQRTNIYQPSLVGGRANAAVPGTLLLGLGDLDDNGDGNPVATKYKNISANAHLELRPNDNTNAFLSMGIANGGGLFFNSQGVGYANGTDYWTQARVQSGGFFGQLSYNYNDGGTASEPTFLYASGFRQVAKRASLEAQLQYNFDVPSFLNSNFTVGMDYRDIMSESEGTLFGINDPNDAYRITGFYLQGTTSITEQLELTYAGRYDKFNFIEDGAFAPRVALVYKASPKHTFRASYNIATFGPTALEQNIDFPVNIPAPGIYDIWLSGQSREQSFSDNPMIDLSIPGAPDIPFGTPGLPLAIPYGAVAGDVLPQVFAGLGANPATAGLVVPLQTFFNNYVPSLTATTGQLVGRNVFNGEPMNELVGTPTSSIGTVSSWEVGYSGLIGDKLKVGVDVYSYERKGFTQFTAIGPTYSLNNASDLPGDLSALVSTDVQSFLTGTLGLPTPNAAAVAGLIGAGFAAGGAGFGSAIAPLTTIIGVVETNVIPDDNIAHAPAGYRRFGDATRSHWGSDVSIEYFATDRMSFWANGSYISQNIWIPGEPDDDNLPFSSYLNSPQFKYRAGFKYAEDDGVRLSISFQHDDAFESNQGFFSGTVQEKNLVDTNLGYDFGNGLELDLSATNLFDQKYRAFPNTPVIGRRAILKATYSF